MSDRPDPADLQRRLERLSAALSQQPAALRPPAAPPPAPAQTSGKAVRNAGLGGLALGMALLSVGLVIGNPALAISGAFLALVCGAFAVIYAGTQAVAKLATPQRDNSRPYIGMGATIEQGAVVEPGATVEMGATVRSGAVVKRGAVLKMGATLHQDATLEEGAVVGWGAEIQRGARVGPGAVVGAGATVNGGAVVPANMKLLPGATWAQTVTTSVAPPLTVPSRVSDPRVDRIENACRRIEAELAQAPEQIRAWLGESAGSVLALKDTARALVERERLLRAEASPDSFAFLDQEQQALESKLAGATDASVKTSLQSALQALQEQRRQRESVKLSADRLDAELTRMQYTLEGMSTQLVRLRTAGDANVPPAADVVKNVQQLHDEIDAITHALEELNAPEPRLQPIAPIEGGEAIPSPGERVR